MVPKNELKERARLANKGKYAEEDELDEEEQ